MEGLGHPKSPWVRNRLKGCRTDRLIGRDRRVLCVRQLERRRFYAGGVEIHSFLLASMEGLLHHLKEETVTSEYIISACTFRWGPYKPPLGEGDVYTLLSPSFPLTSLSATWAQSRVKNHIVTKTYWTLRLGFIHACMVAPFHFPP